MIKKVVSGLIVMGAYNSLIHAVDLAFGIQADWPYVGVGIVVTLVWCVIYYWQWGLE